MSSLITKRQLRPLLLIILASFLLTGCGVQLGSANWPSLSAFNEIVYLAYGPAVVAVDVAQQERLWSFPAEPGRVEFYAPPSVDQEQVIIGDFGAQGGFFSPGLVVSVYGLAREEGDPELIWQNSVAAADKIVAPPLQVGEVVYVGTGDNHLLALDATTGDLMWDFEAGHSIWAQPTFDNGVLYVASMDKALYALDASTGDVLWQTGLRGAISSKPVLADGVVYVGSFDEALHAIDAASGEELWAAPAEDWVWAAAAVAGDVVYFADIQGNIFAVDRRSQQLLWTEQAAGLVQADLVHMDGVIYVASVGDEASGEGQLLALSADDGTVLWEESTAAPIHTTPVVVDDSIVVVIVEEEAAQLLVFDRLAGTQRWQFTPASG